MAFCLNVPHFCYVYLSQIVSVDHPLSFTTVALLVSIEKFGYSFGFVANMLYMMQQIAPGKYKMTHYAFSCTALMNLVLVPTQMAKRVRSPIGSAIGASSSSSCSPPSPRSRPPGSPPSRTPPIPATSPKTIRRATTNQTPTP